jgi:uncharacterized protein (DUF362 family)
VRVNLNRGWEAFSESLGLRGEVTKKITVIEQNQEAGMDKVAFTAGGTRSQNIGNALRLIEKDIDLSGKSDLLIKVNFVNTEIQAAATHVEGVRALLQFLRERYSGRITIGEACLGPASSGFHNYGYQGLVKEFGVRLVDLNEGDWEILDLYDSEFKPMKVHFSKQLIESDYLVAIGPPKTHDSVVVTLSIKNVAMGGVSYKHNDKHKIHQGPQVMNLNLYLMAAKRLPDLSIIDGFTAMEGNGPEYGDPLEWQIAAASCNAVATDSLTAGLMGFDVSEIGYLSYLGKKGYGATSPGQMEILGQKPENYKRKFKPHSTFASQKLWRDERVNRLLGF